MPVGLGGIVCRECGGVGCSACNNSGYAKSYHRECIFDLKKQQEVWADKSIVPMPYGKLLPDLTDCYYANLREPESFICPNCGSDNVVGLDDEHNPDIVAENRTPSGRWFCISCQDSWCYEREE